MDIPLIDIAPYVLVVIFILYIAAKTVRSSKRQQIATRADQKKHYQYSTKINLITPAELKFYQLLVRAVNQQYAVIPQAHLSTFLDHRIKGQDWRAAFTRINQKSVDFLLCDPVTLRPKLAIELDDQSHEQTDRKTRDMFVESILSDAHMKLIRFKVGEWGSVEQIKQRISIDNSV